MLILSGLVITFIIVVWLQAALKNTLIPHNLGMNQQMFAQLTPLMSGVSSQTSMKEKFVEPLPFRDDLFESKRRFLEAAKATGQCRITNEYKNYMHLVFTSSFFQLNDDVEVFFDDVLHRIHYQSVARINYFDRDRNLKRYQAIKKLYLD